MLKQVVFFIFTLSLLSCNKSIEIPGYTLIEKRFVKEVNADCYYFKHNKSGARVFKIAADDANKTFSVSFKTLPDNDCGTPHILEHSVLNGSKNFPVKSPFDVLSKGSLKTFLNAMTGSDRTMYPAASLNEKDYFNLMHVYYDAVFNPLIYNDPNILKQEGWHYELTEKDQDIIYKGVVYNEMKGAFSSPDREMDYQISRILFPENTYGFSSGGYPEAIPELTYESFLDFHRKFYHPSNSYIYFYGDADMVKELTFIDSLYLSNYDVSDKLYEVSIHPSFDEMKEASGYYSVPEGSKTVDKTYVSLTYVIGDGTDIVMSRTLDVLTDVLVNQQSAPIRLALQEAGLGSDVSAWTYPLRQHLVQINIPKANASDKERIKTIIDSTLQQVVANGLEKEALEGVINRLDFRLREGNDANKGMTYMYGQLNNWLHAGDPFIGLEYEKSLVALKEGLQNSYFEDVIQKQLIDNTYKLLYVMEPKPGLEKEKSAKIKQELEAYKASLSKEEINALIEEKKILIAEQEAEDSPEALATIPTLKLSDINPEVDWYEVETKDLNGNMVLHFNAFTNNILYNQYLFNLKVLPTELLPYVSVYAQLLGKLDTENYAYSDLENSLKIHLGGFSSGFITFTNEDNNRELVPFYRVKVKATNEKADKAFELSEEVLLRTKFSDTERIKNVLTNQKSRLENNIKSNGFEIALRRLLSYHSETGVFNQKIKGLDYYWFLSDLLNNYENRSAELVDKLNTISESLITKENLEFATTCSVEDFANTEEKIAAIFVALPSQERSLLSWNLEPEVKNEGFMTASKVQFVLQGANYFDLGYEYKGNMEVLNKIVNADWLKKEIRIKGGAYGGFGYFNESGTAFYASYRDPNLTNTLDVYKGTANFLRMYETDSTEMLRSIIGTFSSIDRPLTPVQKGDRALTRYYSGAKKEIMQERRSSVLNTTIEDIRAYAPLVEKVMHENIYCVYGNQQLILENKELFKTTRTVIE